MNNKIEPEMPDIITEQYGHKVRVRACGILIHEDTILLIEHKGLNDSDSFWSPPGGGVEFGETAEQAVIREFKEETGLKISIEKYLFTNEFISRRLHAIELFFSVTAHSKKLIQGHDPELNPSKQIIKNLDYVTFDELAVMDNKNLHNSLHNAEDAKYLLNMKGYFKFYQ